MEGEVGAEIDFVSDNVDHNLITIGHNTSCHRGDCRAHYCSDASRQDPYMQTSYCLWSQRGVETVAVLLKSCTQVFGEANLCE